MAFRALMGHGPAWDLRPLGILWDPATHPEWLTGNSLAFHSVLNYCPTSESPQQPGSFKSLAEPEPQLWAGLRDGNSGVHPPTAPPAGLLHLLFIDNFCEFCSIGISPPCHPQSTVGTRLLPVENTSITRFWGTAMMYTLLLQQICMHNPTPHLVPQHRRKMGTSWLLLSYFP